MLAEQRESWAAFAATMNGLLEPGTAPTLRKIGEKR
jgi:hypothetical protein